MSPTKQRPLLLPLWAALAALAPFSVEAAALTYDIGFWGGFADGLLGLLKLLISPVVSVSIVDPAADSWTYTLGYYLGVLTFAAAGGMAASAAPSEPTLNLKVAGDSSHRSAG